MASDDLKIANTSARRPPRNVMMGGLQRAKLAGEQLAGASGSGSAFAHASRDNMTAFMAELGNQQKMADITSTMSEIRRLGAIDASTDTRSMYKDATEARPIDYLRTGVEVASVASGIAGNLADAGTTMVDDVVEVTDDDGKPVLDDKGNPVTRKVKRQELSGFAKGARGFQDFIGSIIPAEGRRIKEQREARKSSIEMSNMMAEMGARNMANNIMTGRALKEQQESMSTFIEDQRGIMARANEETQRQYEVLVEANRIVAEKFRDDPSVIPNGAFSYMDPVFDGDHAFIKDARGKVVFSMKASDYRSRFMAPGQPGLTGPLMNEIAKGEINHIKGGPGGYNSFNRGKSGDSLHIASKDHFGKDFTEMTLGEVMKLQEDGKVFAVGRYQFTPAPLKKYVEKHKLDKNAKFDKGLQEKLGSLFLREKRPQVETYLKAKNPTAKQRQAALIAIAQEWSSVEDPRTGKSYYQGDSASTEWESIEALLEEARQRYQYGSREGMKP